MTHSGSLAGVAQLVEHKLPKLGVAGSNPVARSRSRSSLLFKEGFPFLRGLKVQACFDEWMTTVLDSELKLFLTGI